MGVATVPAASAGFDPTKMTLRHTITATTSSIGIPADVTQVYVVVAGGGAGGVGGAEGGFQIIVEPSKFLPFSQTFALSLQKNVYSTFEPAVL